MAEEEVPIGESSQIDQAFYDAETQQLRMKFKKSEYMYQRVDQETVDGLSSATSPGQYWNGVKGSFGYQRIG